MEIRVLRYFLAAAREGSITAAANYLHLTQPTLSRQLRDLEDELGRKLFERRSHRIELTADGLLLRRRAEEIVAMVDKTEAEFASMEGVVAGDVYIGGGETQALRPLAELIRSLRESHPGIRFHLHSGNAEDVTERLDKGLLDFGILIQPADLSKYDCLRLPARDVWGVVMRRDDPLAAKPAIERGDLAAAPLILSRQAMDTRGAGNEFIDWFGGDLGALNVVSTFNLVYNAAILVEAGVGWAVTLDGLINSSAGSALCFRPLSPRLEAGLDIVWKKNQLFSPAAELFLRHLREWLT